MKVNAILMVLGLCASAAAHADITCDSTVEPKTGVNLENLGGGHFAFTVYGATIANGSALREDFATTGVIAYTGTSYLDGEGFSLSVSNGTNENLPPLPPFTQFWATLTVNGKTLSVACAKQ